MYRFSYALLGLQASHICDIHRIVEEHYNFLGPLFPFLTLRLPYRPRACLGSICAC